ncbi:MAG: outer membrane lipoprotein carrier protein LolA [Vicingaceae bacterium]
MKTLIYNIALSIAVGAFVFSAKAQTDPKAKSLLDKVSAKTKAYTSIKADFNYTLENKADDINEVQSGSIAIKGNKYILKIAGQEIQSDGKTIWTYLKDAGEVQITEVDLENEDLITPTKLFTMYEKGYRHEYMKEDVLDGVAVAVINIYPLDVDEKSYHTVKLYIDKEKLEFKKVKILGKEGNTYTYRIKSFMTNIPMNDSDFKFDASKKPGVEVVDLR